MLLANIAEFLRQGASNAPIVFLVVVGLTYLAGKILRAVEYDDLVCDGPACHLQRSAGGMVALLALGGAFH